MAEQISPRLAYKSGIILVMCMIIILTVNGLALALNPQHFGDDLGLYEIPTALPSQTSIATSSTQPAEAAPAAGVDQAQPTATAVLPTATALAPTATPESTAAPAEPAAAVVEPLPPEPVWNAQPVEEAAPVVEEPLPTTEIPPVSEPQPPTEAAIIPTDTIATAEEGEQREVVPTAESLVTEIPADSAYPAPENTEEPGP